MLNDTLLRLLEVSIATSFLILPLCLASRKINRRYGAKWKYYIWLLLAVRLMIPVNLPAVNGFSILPDLSQRQQIQTQEQLIQSQAHTGSQPAGNSAVSVAGTGTGAVCQRTSVFY